MVVGVVVVVGVWFNHALVGCQYKVTNWGVMYAAHKPLNHETARLVFKNGEFIQNHGTIRKE